MMRSQSKYASREEDIGCIDNCLVQTYLTGGFQENIFDMWTVSGVEKIIYVKIQ